ncbi:efflux transporter outer membrane subunit [Pseudomonas sp. SBB6]|uniref:efflux transporter outer membrane subunit n=1 Tax=Pseudomonas sp. SBB6 TaxID=2962032 RepID=UPI0020B69226|nr:efflux transporter outer membrane subunit [Pseudomonas sp. SBB6]MCP3751618.1 efflux transporter outer membrane subunit [Pseudomonas sp. SBB6]
MEPSHSIQHWLAVCLLLALPGCVSPGHSPEPPKPLSPEQLEAGLDIEHAATQPASQADDRWWLSFNDADLDRLLAAALDTSPSLAIASARIDRAQADAGITLANTRPNLSAMTQILRSQDSQNYKTGANEAGVWHTDGQALLQGRYNLDLWGLNRSLNEAAVGSLRAAQADQAVARLALSGSLVETWFALGGVLEQQAIVNQTLEQRRSILRLSEDRLKSGLGTQVDVVRARGPIPLLEAEQARLQGAARGYQLRLAALAGKGPGWGEQWQPKVADPRRSVALPGHLPAELIGGRPDVVAQRWRVEAQGKRIGAARAAFYPNIDLLAFAGFQSFSFQNLFHHDSRTYGVGPAVTLPIFDAGRLRGQYRAQQAGYAEAVASYNQTLVNALSEVAGHVSQLRAIEGQRLKTVQGLDEAEQVYDLENLRYRQSLTDFLHVLDAQTRVLDTRMQLVQLKTSALQNHAGLLRALGGGWKEADQNSTTLAGTSHD